MWANTPFPKESPWYAYLQYVIHIMLCPAPILIHISCNNTECRALQLGYGKPSGVKSYPYPNMEKK